MRAILSYRLSIRIRSSNSAGGRDDMIAPSHNNTLEETYRRVALSAGGCGRSGRVGHAEAMGGFAGGGQYQRAQKWRCRCRRQAYCFAISATAGGEHHHRSLPATGEPQQHHHVCCDVPWRRHLRVSARQILALLHCRAGRAKRRQCGQRWQLERCITALPLQRRVRVRKRRHGRAAGRRPRDVTPHELWADRRQRRAVERRRGGGPDCRQIESLQYRRSPECIVGLGPGEDRGRQCGSRGGGGRETRCASQGIISIELLGLQLSRREAASERRI